MVVFKRDFRTLKRTPEFIKGVHLRVLCTSIVVFNILCILCFMIFTLGRLYCRHSLVIYKVYNCNSILYFSHTNYTNVYIFPWNFYYSFLFLWYCLLVRTKIFLVYLQVNFYIDFNFWVTSEFIICLSYVDFLFNHLTF